MKSKKSILVAIVFIILVVVYFVLSTSSCGAKAPEAAAPEASATASAPEAPAVEAQSADKDAQSSESTAPLPTPETIQEPIILENGGELEIVVPEGMDHDGF